MKRILATLLAAAMLLLAMPVGVLAADTVALNTATDNTAVCPGEEVTFTVSLEEATVSALAIRFGAAYDSALFDFVSAAWLIDGILQDVDTDKLNAALAFSEATVCSGDVFTFTLRAKEAVSTAAVEICADAVVKLNADSLTVAAEGTTVQLGDHVWSGTDCTNCDAVRELDEVAVHAETYRNVTFTVYEKADGTHKLVISGATDMPAWSHLDAYDYAATINEVVVEEGITSLRYGGFQNMKALASVSLPNTLTLIDTICFNGCSALKEVNIPSSVKEIRNKAFMGTAVTSVSVPDGVLLGTAVWMNCKSLTSATLGAIKWTDTTGAVRPWVPQQCFANCSKLTKVTFSTKITAINKSAFSKTGFTSISIPGHIRSVADSAFASCASLTSLTLEEGVRSLGYRAMGACAKLTDVNFNSSELNAFGAGVFVSCYALEEIEIPALITKITADMFFDCKTLKAVDMSASAVTTIASRAFYKCVELTNVKMPATLTTIEKHAFFNCKMLPSIQIPSKVKTVGSYVFNSCKALDTVYLDSATVVSTLTGATKAGEVIRHASTLYINTAVTSIPTYITDTFAANGTKTVNGVTYKVYVRK